jgi:hypothetical protein
MGDNINIGNEQRQFNGGNGANNNNSVSRKKTNNGKRERKTNLQYISILFRILQVVVAAVVI